VQPAVVLVEAARLVDRGEHGEIVLLGELEVLGTAPGGDVDDAGTRCKIDLVPGDDAMLDCGSGLERVEGTTVTEPDQLLPPQLLREDLVREQLHGDPVAGLEQPVLGPGIHRGCNVRRQRPRRRRPDDESLVLVLEEREPDEERRVDAVLVVAVELVSGDRRPATRTPLRRAVTEDEPPALVDELQELPDVLDVRVGEREIVAPPVHPLAEADRPLGERARRLHDHVPAAARELREPVLLDLALRVEAELALDADLDPQSLTVEAVLVALVEAAERLVALEDVLQGAPPGRVDAEHHPVRGDRSVDEAEARSIGVLRAQSRERLLALPGLEHRELERVVVGLVRERCEDPVHARSV
jgi:hypothetical protein